MTVYYYATGIAVVSAGVWCLAVSSTRRRRGDASETTRARAARYVPRHLTEKHNLEDTAVVARVSDVSGGKS